MDLNREWWSGNTSSIKDNSNDVIVEYLSNSLYTSITADSEKYIGVEWDKSACPWKINAQSDFFGNMNWMLGWDTGYHETVKKAQSRLFKERQKGYTFYLSSNGNQNMSGAESRMFPCWMGTLSRSDIDLTDPVTLSWIQDKYKELHPVIDFDYTKIFAVPFLQRTGYGTRTLFSEDLRNSWNAASYSGWGVAFYYHSNQTTYPAIDLGLDIVSLNNKFAPPDWDTTIIFETEEFDNGFCPVSYAYDNSTLYWRAQLGQRYQIDATGSSPGTLFDQQYQAGADAAGAAQYYPNRCLWVNGTADNAIYQSDYIAGNLQQNQYRPFERTFNPSLTFDQAKEYFATQLAYLGFRFSLEGSNLNNDINSQYFYIPEIDELGVTTGNYYQANTAEAELLPNYGWTTDVYHVTPYDGTNDDDEEGDPNTYSETTDWNDFTQSPTLSFTDMYILDELSIAGLATKFFESLSLKPVDQLVTEYFSQTYLTTEPTDVIVSLRYYYIPLDTKVSHSSTLEEILLGTYHTGVSGYNVTCTTARYDYGEHLYYPHFGDFRDYAPYSTAILIIPYCGTVSIDPQEFMGHYVRVQMVIDYATGTCTAYIMKDELVVNSISGQIGIEIPVTAIAGQDLQRNLFNGYQNLKAAKLQSAQSMAQGAMSFLGSAMSSNPLGMSQSVMSTIFGEERSEIGIEAAEYNLQHTQVPFRQVGSINPGAAVRQEQQCRLIIFRPVMDPDYDPVEYGHVTGFATLETGLLSEYTGFTQCSNVILDSLPCTIEEKQSIERLLQSGVYL